MYTPLEQQIQKKGKSPVRHNKQLLAAASQKTSPVAKEEKKNPFWDNLDCTNWMPDNMAKSCLICKHEFT